MRAKTTPSTGIRIGLPLLLLAVMVPVIMVALVAGVGATSPTRPECGPATIGGHQVDAEQLGVAAQVVAAVRGFTPTTDNPHAAVVALATARQESGIRNLHYGDLDSLGVFQQRPSQGWGTRQQTLDITHATRTFLRRLVAIRGWERMPVTDAAAAVQRPATEYRGRYEQWVPLATALTEQLWPTSLTQPGEPPGSGAETSVRISHANLWVGMSPAGFAADLAGVAADRPDFITLNETYHRSPAQLTPPGYAMWRSEAPRDARETPVLWRTDTWQLRDQGTVLMHDRDVTWGTRYVNWVTVASAVGHRVSVIAGHASPAGPGRDGLLGDYVDRLNALITTLSASGPVLVGADLNTHYPTSGFLTGWLAATSTVSTFDALGEPAGGWATGQGGGTIDYVLVAGATPQSHRTVELAHSDHRMLSATVTLAPAGATPCGGLGGAGVPGTCTATGGPAEVGLTPDALRVMRCVLTVFGPHPVGGLGERPNDSDHPAGRAVDIIIDAWDTPAGNTHGWQIARWARVNATQLGITYVIFDAKIWSVARTAEGWRPYTHPTAETSPTLAHRDHVHVSVVGDAGTDTPAPASGWGHAPPPGIDPGDPVTR